MKRDYDQAIEERLENSDVTLDVTALVNDLDDDGFDFAPYLIPEESGSK